MGETSLSTSKCFIIFLTYFTVCTEVCVLRFPANFCHVCLGRRCTSLYACLCPCVCVSAFMHGYIYV